MSTDAPQRSSRIAILALILAAAGFAMALLFPRDHAPPLPQELAGMLAEHPAPIVLATHHVAYRALRTDEDVAMRPVALLSSWPPSSLVLSYRDEAERFERAGMTRAATQDGWTIWEPATLSTLPLFDLARVETMDARSKATPCPRDDAGFARCGEPDWMRPGPREVEIDGVSATCNWAHPLPGKTLRITYPEMPTRDDQGRTLTLLTGLRDSSVGTRVPVEVRVTWGEVQLHHTHHDRRGWQVLPLQTERETASLRLDITATEPGRRHFCYRFEYR
ncbi:hypothetical protein EA187_11615 [Lujinxingia sediminis]|uniref:Uncharacterized protein n=1 Tax=Lujinxingia sediminis TaxID=2480984 RepID=A0ABY0CTN1_9DELT|nr:hypothetical protein [Lujinxingia sediminis]RVU44186.1 hypothetical protein EA187_11615 [Lujinxingia sediminis]